MSKFMAKPIPWVGFFFCTFLSYNFSITNAYLQLLSNLCTQ